MPKPKIAGKSLEWWSALINEAGCLGLPRPEIRVVDLPSDRIGQYGPEYGVIRVDKDHYERSEPYHVVGTIAHEKIHFYVAFHRRWAANPHDFLFRSRAAELGLSVTDTGVTRYMDRGLFRDLLTRNGVSMPTQPAAQRCGRLKACPCRRGQRCPNCWFMTGAVMGQISGGYGGFSGGGNGGHQGYQGYQPSEPTPEATNPTSNIDPCCGFFLAVVGALILRVFFPPDREKEAREAEQKENEKRWKIESKRYERIAEENRRQEENRHKEAMAKAQVELVRINRQPALPPPTPPKPVLALPPPPPPRTPTPDEISAEAHARYERNCRRIRASSLPTEQQDTLLREELLLLEQRLRDAME